MKLVTIDFFPESVSRYSHYDAVVCLDILRATTTLVTGVIQERRSIPASSVDHAWELARNEGDPLLAGELGGDKPEGFELQNSPSAIAQRRDVWRPLILVSTSGTRLLVRASCRDGVYVACLRNLVATADFLARHHQRVAIIGAGVRDQLRCEDQLGAARLAAMLVARGFAPSSADTAGTIQRWGTVSPQLVRLGRSAEYLARTGQLADLEFVLGHVDDADLVCALRLGELARITDPPQRLAQRPLAPSNATALSDIA